MRFLRASVVSVLVAALAVYPTIAVASADRGSWNNWHVHDGFPGHDAPYTDENGLRHAALSVWPEIFGPTYAADPSLWAYCTDATDKALVGGDGGAKANAGHCQNDLHIIHLLGVRAGAPVPPGWTAVPSTIDDPFTIYYHLTAR